jgi:hypothetical protein
MKLKLTAILLIILQNLGMKLIPDPLLVSPIERVHNNGAEKRFKLLGVYFDQYLSFDAHVNHLCIKLSKSLYGLNKVKNFINKDALKKLYFVLVHSIHL